MVDAMHVTVRKAVIAAALASVGVAFAACDEDVAPSAAPQVDASASPDATQAAVAHGSGDASLLDAAADAARCTGDFPDANIEPYSSPPANYDAGPPCPDGEIRAIDYMGPSPFDGASPYSPVEGFDGLCHRLCRCDGDCTSAEPVCKPIHFMRGDDVASGGTTKTICRAVDAG